MSGRDTDKLTHQVRQTPLTTRNVHLSMTLNANWMAASDYSMGSDTKFSAEQLVRVAERYSATRFIVLVIHPLTEDYGYS
eukprot:scaffold319681_cov47-Prasinocladus_malaysianus.AAC.1